MKHFTEYLHEFYFFMPNFNRLGFLGKVIERLYGRILKKLMDKFLVSYYEKTIDSFSLNDIKRDQPVICSLTSFPARIDQLWIAIECLFRQTFKPDEIYLWLSKEQFPEEKLPELIRKQETKGLKVFFVEDDLKAHKKYIYSLENCAENAIISTYDDDLYIDRNNLRNVLNIYKSNPNSIATNRAHKVKISKGVLKPYRKWSHNVITNTSGFGLVATGGYGTVYLKSMFYSGFNNASLIKRLCPLADDLWLKIMSLLNEKKVATNSKYGKDPIPILSSQQEKLVTQNVLSGGNDNQLNNLMEYFKIQANAFNDF